MKIIKTLSFGLAILLGSSFSTFADDVAANKKNLVDVFFAYNKSNCHVAPPVDIKIVKEPEHGKVTVARERRQLFGKCKSATALVSVIYYTPNRNYRGKDQFRYRASFLKYVDGSAKINKSRTIKLNVK